MHLRFALYYPFHHRLVLSIDICELRFPSVVRIMSYSLSIQLFLVFSVFSGLSINVLWSIELAIFCTSRSLDKWNFWVSLIDVQKPYNLSNVSLHDLLCFAVSSTLSSLLQIFQIQVLRTLIIVLRCPIFEIQWTEYLLLRFFVSLLLTLLIFARSFRFAFLLRIMTVNIYYSSNMLLIVFCLHKNLWWFSAAIHLNVSLIFRQNTKDCNKFITLIILNISFSSLNLIKKLKG